MVNLRANLIAGEYVWSWTSKVWRADAQSPELIYRQSTFLSRVLSPEKLAKRSSNFVPKASPVIELDRHCLALFDGERSLGEIASDLAAAFPGQFDGSVDALTHVSMVASRYPVGDAQMNAPLEDDQQ